MLRPFRLERDLDRAVMQWIHWLPRWDPEVARRRGDVCTGCLRWSHELGLSGAPHGVVHALVTSVEMLVHEHFQRTAAARYSRLAPGGEWRAIVEHGVVRLLRTDAGDPAELLRDPLPSGPMLDEDALAVRIELTVVYDRLRNEAGRRVRTQSELIGEAMNVAVESKVRRMTESLLSDITAMQADPDFF